MHGFIRYTDVVACKISAESEAARGELFLDFIDLIWSPFRELLR